MYTRKQLRRLLAEYYGDPALELDARAARLMPWDLAEIIAAVERRKSNKS